MIKRKINLRRGKPESVKATERICDLADAFAAASPEKQQAGLDILAAEIRNEKNKTARGWMTLFRRTFEFLQTDAGEKIKPRNDSGD